MLIKEDLAEPEVPELNMIEADRLSAVQNPKKSCRRHSQELGLSWISTVRRVKLDFKLFPYHIQVKQEN